MRQLLIVAVEGPDDQAITDTYIALQVPRLSKDLRAIAMIINETFKPKAIADTAKRCVETLQDCTGSLLTIVPEQTAGEVIIAGYQQLMAVVDRHEREIARQGRFNERVLGAVIGDVDGNADPR